MSLSLGDETEVEKQIRKKESVLQHELKMAALIQSPVRSKENWAKGIYGHVETLSRREVRSGNGMVGPPSPIRQNQYRSPGTPRLLPEKEAAKFEEEATPPPPPLPSPPPIQLLSSSSGNSIGSAKYDDIRRKLLLRSFGLVDAHRVGFVTLGQLQTFICFLGTRVVGFGGDGEEVEFEQSHFIEILSSNNYLSTMPNADFLNLLEQYLEAMMLSGAQKAALSSVGEALTNTFRVGRNLPEGGFEVFALINRAVVSDLAKELGVEEPMIELCEELEKIYRGKDDEDDNEVGEARFLGTFATLVRGGVEEGELEDICRRAVDEGETRLIEAAEEMGRVEVEVEVAEEKDEKDEKDEEIEKLKEKLRIAEAKLEQQQQQKEQNLPPNIIDNLKKKYLIDGGPQLSSSNNSVISISSGSNNDRKVVVMKGVGPPPPTPPRRRLESAPASFFNRRNSNNDNNSDANRENKLGVLSDNELKKLLGASLLELDNLLDLSSGGGGGEYKEKEEEPVATQPAPIAAQPSSLLARSITTTRRTNQIISTWKSHPNELISITEFGLFMMRNLPQGEGAKLKTEAENVELCLQFFAGMPDELFEERLEAYDLCMRQGGRGGSRCRIFESVRKVLEYAGTGIKEGELFSFGRCLREGFEWAWVKKLMGIMDNCKDSEEMKRAQFWGFFSKVTEGMGGKEVEEGVRRFVKIAGKTFRGMDNLENGNGNGNGNRGGRRESLEGIFETESAAEFTPGPQSLFKSLEGGGGEGGRGGGGKNKGAKIRDLRSRQ